MSSHYYCEDIQQTYHVNNPDGCAHSQPLSSVDSRVYPDDWFFCKAPARSTYLLVLIQSW